MQGWGTLGAEGIEKCWGLSSSSSFPVPGREVRARLAIGPILWAEHEALMADFCPVGLLGGSFVADGPLPGSQT